MQLFIYLCNYSSICRLTYLFVLPLFKPEKTLKHFEFIHFLNENQCDVKPPERNGYCFFIPQAGSLLHDHSINLDLSIMKEEIINGLFSNNVQ